MQLIQDFSGWKFFRTEAPNLEETRTPRSSPVTIQCDSNSDQATAITLLYKQNITIISKMITFQRNSKSNVMKFFKILFNNSKQASLWFL